ncbi:hypothetical protein CYMTET_54403 [Cymbomonas tetramitiformis]|uniref:histidine kinase n=1 Tax=Cymbomonas tetramitiformis TaxID=36881 RepID=A0AAE0BG96_9CHLO|nr:hypothetical protein CYMTET_54403 [Cymbomonas tetramitiformis]
MNTECRTTWAEYSYIFKCLTNYTTITVTAVSTGKEEDIHAAVRAYNETVVKDLELLFTGPFWESFEGRVRSTWTILQEQHDARVKESTEVTVIFACMAGSLVVSAVAWSLLFIWVTISFVEGEARQRSARLQDETKAAFARLLHDLKTPVAVLCNKANELSEDLIRFAGCDVCNSATGNVLLSVEFLKSMCFILDTRASAFSRSKLTPADAIWTDCVKNCILDVSALYKPLFYKCDHLKYKVEVNIQPGLQCLYPKETIQRCVENLLSNALKFTSAGSIRLRATVDEPSDSLHIQVIDTGKGVPSEQKANIFQGTQLQLSSGGLGIGLQSVAILAESVECFDNPDAPQGTTFGFTVLLKNVTHNFRTQTPIERSLTIEDVPSGVAPKAEYSCNHDATKSFPQDPSFTSLLKPALLSAEENSGGNGVSGPVTFHLLLVEDDMLQLRMLRRKIEKTFPSIIIDQAGDGQIGLQKICESQFAGKPYACILSDFNMPIYDGYSMLMRAAELHGIDFDCCAIMSANVEEIPTGWPGLAVSKMITDDAEPGDDGDTTDDDDIYI